MTLLFNFFLKANGDYHCDSIFVNFGSEIWEDAVVLNENGGIDRMDLIYSYFNGVYIIVSYLI